MLGVDASKVSGLDLKGLLLGFFAFLSCFISPSPHWLISEGGDNRSCLLLHALKEKRGGRGNLRQNKLVVATMAEGVVQKDISGWERRQRDAM